MNNETLAELAVKKLEMVTGGLKDFRLTHLELFKQKGLLSDPEAYKFTNLSSFMSQLDYSPYEPADISPDQYLHPDFINLVFIDGEFQGNQSVAGVQLSTLEDSFQNYSDNFAAEHPFSHLHHSLLSSGVVIEIAKDTKLEKPIRLLNVITRSGINAPTFIIKANEFAQASIIEETIDHHIAHAHLSETYIWTGTGANLEHVQLAQASESALLHSATRSYVAKDASYRNVLINLSAKLTRRNLSLELQASGAHGESYNLYLTSGSEHSDINTVIHHKAADTTSDQIAKGILDGDSKGIFTGKIHIHPQAQRVASGQLNKNLLLSKKAQAHSQPQLEIFADDVKCSHGSTTGQLSDDEVFYFEARGIPADKARTLLAHGFGMEIVLKIKNKATRELVEKYVMNSLATKFQLGGGK